jgi:hypothetical protein
MIGVAGNLSQPEASWRSGSRGDIGYDEEGIEDTRDRQNRPHSLFTVARAPPDYTLFTSYVSIYAYS